MKINKRRHLVNMENVKTNHKSKKYGRLTDNIRTLIFLKAKYIQNCLNKRFLS